MGVSNLTVYSLLFDALFMKRATSPAFSSLGDLTTLGSGIKMYLVLKVGKDEVVRKSPSQ